MRRLRILAVGALLTLTAPAPGWAIELPPGGTFFDDDGNVHETSIEAIAEIGITRGCGAEATDLFCPEQEVTRAQMAAFLVRALDLPPSGDDVFDDDDGSVFEADIQALAAAGITRGCGKRRFCPNDQVLRGQMAAFLVRAFGYPASEADVFTDDDGSRFEADIQALAAAGITQGCGEGRYCPSGVVRRDQMASFLARALGLPGIVPPPRPTRTVVFTGDTLIHTQLIDRAAVNGDRSGRPYDFGPMLSPVADLISGADLAICHLEVSLSATNARLSGYPRFNAPRDLADALAGAGYDGCSTASNHSIDQGPEGVRSTLAILEQAGLAQAGMAASEETAERATIYDIDGVALAHLSATWSLNGLREPPDQPWLVQDLDADEILDQAESAKADGADFVVVSVHCCTEYQTLPVPYQRGVDRALVDSPHVDLVIGHHAHVVQPIERRRDEYVVYGLGNFLSGQRRLAETTDGVIVFADLALRDDTWVVRGIRYTPTWVEAGTYRVLPAAETIRSGTAGGLTSVLRSSWSRTSRAVNAFGADEVTPTAKP